MYLKWQNIYIPKAGVSFTFRRNGAVIFIFNSNLVILLVLGECRTNNQQTFILYAQILIG